MKLGVENKNIPFTEVVLCSILKSFFCFRLCHIQLYYYNRIGSIMALKVNDTEMVMTRARLMTFKNWPFDEGSSCTPQKMAEAGFYCCGSVSEPDLVRCFFCRKELDGWDPEDDPWAEHVGHAKGKCGFVNLGKKSDELTVEDMYSLFPQRHGMVVSQILQSRIEMFKKEAEEKRKELEKLL